MLKTGFTKLQNGQEVSNRTIYYPNLSVNKCNKLLAKSILTDDEIEDLKDYKFMLIFDSQMALEKGFLNSLLEGGTSLKNPHLLINIDYAISNAGSNPQDLINNPLVINDTENEIIQIAKNIIKKEDIKIETYNKDLFTLEKKLTINSGDYKGECYTLEGNYSDEEFKNIVVSKFLRKTILQSPNFNINLGVTTNNTENCAEFTYKKKQPKNPTIPRQPNKSNSVKLKRT